MIRFWNWVRNEDGRTLYLNGTIAEESWFEDEVTPAAFKTELMAGEGDITVWINSPGGDCIAASQIYCMLMDYRGAVTVKIDGIAASAASVVAMAGQQSVRFTPEESKKAVALLDEVKESIINAYEIKTGLSRARLSHLMDAETWLSAHKAVEMGFADGLLFGERAEVPEGAADFVFSRRAVTNSLLEKLPRRAEKRIPAGPLYGRLDLLKM